MRAGMRAPWLRGVAGAVMALLASLPTMGQPNVSRFYIAASVQASGVVDGASLAGLPVTVQRAAVPFWARMDLIVPPEPPIPPYPPYRIDPSVSPAEHEALVQVIEGLRISPTGRRLYAYLRRQFGPLSGTLRSLTLTTASFGFEGDNAVASGTPPAYVITLNRDLLMTDQGVQAMVPKLAHEIVHVRDYVHDTSRSVAMEVSAHAADAALAYECNMAAYGTSDGHYSRLISLPDVYEYWYVPFRQQPTAERHVAYWQQLMALVMERRGYGQRYRDPQGETAWNSPPGPAGPGSYVPYDPTFGWPDD